MSLSKDIVKAIRQKQVCGLPEDVRKKVVLHIADTIGISLAAYKGAPIALKSIKGISIGVTSGDCSIIGSKDQLPPAYAAFANTALAHALDFDDIHDNARIHPTPVMLASALAAADISDTKTIDIVTAVGLGNELVCRLGIAIEPKGIGADSKWFLSQLFGYLGAAITAGLVLGLDDTELVNALGLAYMQIAGGKEAGVGVGSQARSIYPAFASMGGVQAALLAKMGVTAPESSLDGKTGLFQNYFGKNLTVAQRKILLDSESWAFSETSIKLYPSCRYSHPYVKAALLLRKEIRYEQINQIVVGVNATARMLCEPLAERCHPKTLQDAKFSIPFLVAFTIVHGSVTLNNLTENALMDTKVLELAKRITIEQTQPDTIGLPLGDIQIKTSEVEKRQIELLRVDVTLEEAKEKFIDCCSFANVSNSELLWESIYNHCDRHTIHNIEVIK